MEAPPLFRSLPYPQNASSSSYSPLPGQPEPVISPAASVPGTRRRRTLGVFTVTVLSAALLVSFAVLILTLGPEPTSEEQEPPPRDAAAPSRGAAQGVSEKAFRPRPGNGESYNWTNAMLSWQRTAYHFQPQKNWMNDPNGPLYHLGWYHLFYQYNPDSAVWGNITWGHAVSRDLIHWLYLPLAMVPDHWFDFNGVWSGSATLLPDGRIIMLYTGDTADYVQVQNLAYPADLSDPLLLHWVKYPNNPVMVPPPGIALKDFRDPTTAWQGPDGIWRVMIGSKTGDTGISLVYRTANFTAYELMGGDGVLHGVPGTGMWECTDFYPVSTWGQNGLDTSANGPGIKHVLKASMDDNKRDYYAIGRYNPVEDKWTPDDPNEDVGIGLRVDYGRYYASKTFFDQSTGRRILWGWARETDSEFDDLRKGWASLQTIPRVVVFDNKTGTNLLQWPVEEVESLRLNSTEFVAVEVASGSVVPLQVGPADELDIVAEFEVDAEALLEAAAEEVSDVSYNCSVGAAVRGALGPFGLLVIATDTLSERTPVYFYIAKLKNGHLQPFFCVDETRSSEANDVDHRAFGSRIPVLDGEKFSMRLLVDHSIVESFGQRGRSCITARVYPTQAILGAARLFLFNNATAANVTATVKVWQMSSALLHPFPL